MKFLKRAEIPPCCACGKDFLNEDVYRSVTWLDGKLYTWHERCPGPIIARCAVVEKIAEAAQHYFHDRPPEQADAIEAGALYCEYHGDATPTLEGGCTECWYNEQFEYYGNRGMCAVCSLEAGEDVPVDSCECGAFCDYVCSECEGCEGSVKTEGWSDSDFTGGGVCVCQSAA
jgi:hypothetical protein